LAAPLAICSRPPFRGTQLGLIKGVSTEAESIPAIDMRSISQLAEGDELGKEFIAEIIDVFLGDLRERVRSIGTQISGTDHAGVAATAHAIKGSSGHFGAVRLMDLSSKLEDLAKRGETDGLQTAVDSLVAETERVRIALEEFRAGNAPA
jgi:HPt (histidine-containing phosphotransfer) domain-containing protein